MLLYEKQKRFEFDNHQTRGAGLYSCLRVTLPPHPSPPHLLPIASLVFLVAKLWQESGIYLPLSFYRAITRIYLRGKSEQCQKSPKSGTSAFLIIDGHVTPNSALKHTWCSSMPNYVEMAQKRPLLTTIFLSCYCWYLRGSWVNGSE